MARTQFDYEGVRIPINIRKDRRRSIRYSISQKFVNLVMPYGMPAGTLEREIDNIKKWSIREFEKDPTMLNRFRVIHYQNEEFLRIYGQDFQLLIFEEKRKALSGKLTKNGYVEIRVPFGVDELSKQKAIGQLLSRIFSSYFLKDVVDRVNYYNRTFFQERIENVRLKNNQTNWGSCSSKRNINLASRLLFGPVDVLDYVIVHELSHLKEMNHSPRFWKIVHDVMPNYKDKEKWLKKHGHTLKF